MKQIKPLIKSEAGVIHHLGLILLLVVVIGAGGFAGFRVYQNNQSTDDSPVTVEVDGSESSETEVTPDELDQEISSADAEANAGADATEDL